MARWSAFCRFKAIGGAGADFPGRDLWSLRSSKSPTQGCQLGHFAFDLHTPVQGSFSIPTPPLGLLTPQTPSIPPFSRSLTLNGTPLMGQPRWIPQKFSFSRLPTAPSGSCSLHTCPLFAGKGKKKYSSLHRPLGACQEPQQGRKAWKPVGPAGDLGCLENC